MINLWVRIVGSFFALIISGFVFLSPNHRHEAIPEPNDTVNIKNPIGFFCGSDCSGCDHDVERCLSILKANLKSLCGEASEQDCYGVWIEYAKTCQYLCSKPMMPLTSAAKMVNLVASDA